MKKPHIRKYTEDSYEWINEELRKNGGVPISPSIQKSCQGLYEELGSIPDYQDVVYRGVKIKQKDLQIYEEAYREDKPVREPTFISASCSISIATMFMHVSQGYGSIKVLFEMVSKTGKLIGAYSKHLDEKEVLFLPNTNFRVLSIENKGEIILIRLLEI